MIRGETGIAFASLTLTSAAAENERGIVTNARAHAEVLSSSSALHFLVRMALPPEEISLALPELNCRLLLGDPTCN